MHEFFSFKTEFLGKARRKHMVEICGCSAAHTTTEMHESCTDSFRSKVHCLQRLGPKLRRGPKLSEVSMHFGPPVPCGRCRNLVKHQRILGIPQISLKRPRRTLKRPRRALKRPRRAP